MDDLRTEGGFDLQGMWAIHVVGLFVDMLSMGVCTTRHCQTSGRLSQELNVCTVLTVFETSISTGHIRKWSHLIIGHIVWSTISNRKLELLKSIDTINF